MIPAFTSQGILPPYIGGDPTIPSMMSPYHLDMVGLISAFGRTQARLDIIEGLLDYRQRLNASGFTGFQWLSGSFVEKIEDTQRRAPGDVDVVTIFNRPAHMDDNQWAEFLDGPSGFLINDPHAVKAEFHCDGYAIDLNEDPKDVVELTKYWFGLFSHQRFTSFWKGMLVVQLDAQQDAIARAFLSPTVSQQ